MPAEHLSNRVQHFAFRCAISPRLIASPKQQRRFARYEIDLARCGDEIETLARFVGAQVVAFRKILKKFRKWTGSAALGARFKDAILSDPKSFTRRDFSQLRLRCDGLRATLKATTPTRPSRTISPTGQPGPSSGSSRELYREDEQSPSEFQVQSSSVRSDQGYWNEYDYDEDGNEVQGSHRNDHDYVIYINPDLDSGFWGLSTLINLLKDPFRKARTPPSEEHSRLLAPGTGSYGGTQTSYPSSILGDSSLADTEAEHDSPGDPNTFQESQRRSSFPSSDDFPVGYAVYRPISSNASAAKHIRTTNQATIVSFIASFVLLAVAYILAASGGLESRAEAEAVIAAAAVASLACACAALTMTVARTHRPAWPAGLVVWVAFSVICILNGAVLVFVVGNTEL